MSIPDMDRLRHQIDAMTAHVPEAMTRTQLVTFALAW